ncbi:MAG TPA: hypothetical protein V6C76_11035 [Drouetiella sp.]
MNLRKAGIPTIALVTISLASTLCCFAAPVTKQSPQPVNKNGEKPKSAHPTAMPSMSVDIDTTGIAKSTKVQIVPKEKYDKEEEIVHLNGAPQHVKVIFDGKKVESDNDFMDQHLLIYPIKEWEATFPPMFKKEFNKRISDLKKMIATKSGAGLKELPILPDSDGAELLHSKIKPLAFKSGSGITFIACYGNGDGPYKADDFFYTFQGITADGKNYVSFFWPVTATGMKPDTEQKKAEKFIEDLPRAKFSPSLEALDKAVSSISIK